MTITYNQVSEIMGPLLFLENKHNAINGELVSVLCPDGSTRNGQILALNEDVICVQVFTGTQGLNTEETRVKFHNKLFTVNISESMRGKIFDGMGKPRSIFGQTMNYDIMPEKVISVDDSVINPFGRKNPKNIIETGVSVIDGLNSICRGQKLPIFTGQGLSHNKLIAQIVSQAKLKDDEPFLIIFCGIGILIEDAIYFYRRFQQSENFRNFIFFLNLANDPTIERILAPRVALTVAEYFAFTKNQHVLVIMSDMTNYCEALRELSNSKEELPGRKGFPGYLYSNLATLYERAGQLKDSGGSLTQIPVISMPDDDITHPIPDLTGYITEGQIVLSRELHNKGYYPPVDILSSLSRLMKSAVGLWKTRDDHMDLANQLYSLYAQSLEMRKLQSVIGSEGLSKMDRLLVKFGKRFEKDFLNQQPTEHRSIEETLNLGWEILAELPPDSLYRIDSVHIEKYFSKGKQTEGGT